MRNKLGIVLGILFLSVSMSEVASANYGQYCGDGSNGYYGCPYGYLCANADYTGVGICTTDCSYAAPGDGWDCSAGFWWHPGWGYGGSWGHGGGWGHGGHMGGGPGWGHGGGGHGGGGHGGGHGGHGRR